MKGAEKIEILPVSEIKPYERNARTHDERQVLKIAASITEFGFTNPILIDGDGVIIAGHGRLEAAKSLGFSEVPVIRLPYLDDAQRRALVLADNRLALDAGWDEEILRGELEALKLDGYDMDLTGFSVDELDELLEENRQEVGNTDEDSVPETPERATSETGDLWILGNHRLLCGDSTNASDVEKVLSGEVPHLMVTDPPYGVEYDPAWRDEAAKKCKSMGNGKDTAKGIVENDDRADWSEAYSLFPGEVVYVWHADVKSHVVAKSIESCGFNIRALICWGKNNFAFGRGDYHHQHEPCWYAVKKGATGHWNGDRTQSTLWKIDKPQKSETGHSTQKPVECMRRPILNNSKKGEFIYEPFSGSGTTIIACEETGRKCLAVELNPSYVDIAVRRWQDFTGKKAVLESTGKTFDEIEAERHGE